MKNLFIIFITLSFIGEFKTQNLIINSSFSDVNKKINVSLPYRISPGALSEVKGWYLPTYVNYNLYKKTLGNNLNEVVYYYSSRDKHLVPRDKKYHYNIQTNGDQLFENNLGFVSLYINTRNSLPFIQQKLQYPLTKGNYCFKFKYKFNRSTSSYHRPVSLEFSFSKTDLKEYFHKTLMVPDSLVQVSFMDTINDTDDNEPWIQQSYVLNLKGSERFLSIGTLKNKDKYSWGNFFIDDLELYQLKDNEKCNCELINKDLSTIYNREFPLNEVLSSDSLVMFTPPFNVGSGIVSPDARMYLNNIIAFMQRNPAVKIKLIEYNHFDNSKPMAYINFFRYITFFGIAKDRISVENAFCVDPTGVYCGKDAELVKFDFKFY